MTDSRAGDVGQRDVVERLETDAEYAYEDGACEVSVDLLREAASEIRALRAGRDALTQALEAVLKSIDTFYYGDEIGESREHKYCSQCDHRLPMHRDEGYATCPVLAARRALATDSEGGET